MRKKLDEKIFLKMLLFLKKNPPRTNIYPYTTVLL